MIAIGSALRARQTRHFRQLPNGFSFHRSEWMESGADPHLSPTVFLVEQPPGSVLDPHFHTQNQFQVVMGGGGWLGRHEVGPGSVHYAGAYTGYGPVVAGPEGLNYFTVRAVCETGAHFVSTARDKMIRGPKRHLMGAPVACASLEQLAALAAPRRVALIDPQPDRIEASVWYLPPAASVAMPAPAPSGQFQFAMAGALRDAGGWLSGWESRYRCADEPSGLLEAGPQGAQVLVLQMPAKALEYQTGQSCINRA